MKKVKEFINVSQAKDYKEKYTKLISSLKIPFITSIPITLVFGLMLLADYSPVGIVQEFLWQVLGTIAVIGLPIAWIFVIIKGGALVLKTVLKVAFWGFILIPLPYSLLLGVVTFGLAIICCFAAPTLIFIAVWWQARKEVARAEEYIYYHTLEEA